jgi:hypothetical protein
MQLLAYWSVRCHAAGQLLEHARIHRRVVGDNLNRGDPGCADGPLEGSPSRPGLTPWGDEHLKDLAELVNSTVDVAPLASDSDVGLVGVPSSPDGVAAGPSGLGQQQREPLDLARRRIPCAVRVSAAAARDGRDGVRARQRRPP